jgi:hypothetical protein
MVPVRQLLLAAALVAALAACGGSGGGAPVAVDTVQKVPGGDSDTGKLPAWTDAYVSEPGPEVALILGASDFGAGANRIPFLVVRNDGALVQTPAAEVFIARDGAAKPIETEATLESLQPHNHPKGFAPHDHVDATDFYVANANLATPGRYWLVVQPQGEDIQALGTIDVRQETVSPPVGSTAISSDNPTLDDAPASEITTARPPDSELLRYSIADSLAAHVPFVAVFATPKFCQTRACGPTVQTVDLVRRSLGRNSDIRFIHVEVYEGNDPLNGVNRWFKEWRLPSEPWVFIVDGDGVIKAKFEGLMSVAEIEDAVRKYLR